MSGRWTDDIKGSAGASIRGVAHRGTKHCAAKLLEARHAWRERFGGGFELPLVISGTPRGGTTWMMELLMQVPRCGTIFEPFWPLNPSLRRIPGWGSRLHHIQYIPEDASWSEAERFVAKLLSGRIIEPRSLAARDWPWRRTERFLFKFTHGNRLLPWLVRHFQVLPPIWIVRHPCAVVSSQLRVADRGWHDVVPPFEIVEARFNERFHEPWKGILESLSTREEILAAEWCLDTHYLLRHPGNNASWITVAYERLVKDPQDELTRIFGRLGIPEPAAARQRVRTASRTDFEGNDQIRAETQLTAWQNRLSSEQTDRILAVVDRFGLSDLYGSGPEPDEGVLYGAGQNPVGVA